MDALVKSSKGAAAGGAVLILLGCTPTVSQVADVSAGGRTCFLSRHLDGWAPQDIDAVNVRINHDYFRLTLAEACPEIQEADRIQLRPRGGGSMICVNEAAQSEITAYSKVTGPRRCLVKVMQRLTPVEVASLSRKEKP